MRLNDRFAEQTATDPTGRVWTIGIRWLPRRPTWLGWGPGRRRKRKSQDPPEPSDKWWLDAVDIAGGGVDAPGIVWAIVAIAVIVFLAWFVVVPIAVLAVDLVFLLLLAASTIAARVFLRRPWIVEATTDGEQRHWKVVGFRSSKKMVDEVALSLLRGET